MANVKKRKSGQDDAVDPIGNTQKDWVIRRNFANFILYQNLDPI
jgi:hypothetical protein